MKPTDCQIYQCKTPFDHHRHGGRWYATNAAGTIAHILPGKSAISRCDTSPPGTPTDHLPEGARVCKTCARAADIREYNELSADQNNAINGMGPYRLRLEKRYGTSDPGARELYLTAWNLIKSAPSIKDAWDVYDMYRTDAVHLLERAA